MNLTLGKGNLKQKDDWFNKYLWSAYRGEDLCFKKLTVGSQELVVTPEAGDSTKRLLQ